MKQLLLAGCIVLSTLFSQVFAQTPVYLLFDWNCADQLEYRTNTGGKLVVFNYHPTPNDQYLLTAGEGIITSVNLPTGTINCSEFRLNDMLVDAVNRHTRSVYIVQQTQSGFMLTPITIATHVARTGSIYKFYTTDYSFAVDTNNLNYSQNLIFTGDASVYFTGYKICDCRLQYSFEREAGRANLKRSNFEIIPGIGFITERTGLTNAEKENNQISLVRINNQLLDDYLATRCQRRPPLRTTMSRWAGNPLPEPTRETYPAATVPADLTPVMRNGGSHPAAPVTYNTNPTAVIQPTNCNESFTYGYHIVQRGETAAAIARGYGMDTKTLCVVNQITNPNKINVCQKLRIPDVKSGVVTAGTTAQRQFNWGDLAVPVTYNNNNNNRTAPATYNTPSPQNNLNNIPAGQIINYSGTNTYHIVQPGEYLYSIARSHGINEAQIRKYNGFPAIGVITLYPGDQLWLVDPNEAYRNGQQLPPSGDRPQQYNNTPAPGTKSPGTGSTFIESPVDGVYIRNENENYDENNRYTPKNTDNTLPYVAPLPQQYGPSNTANTGPVPSHFNEHIVKYGETIGSIAQAYGMSVNQLISFNDKTEKEALIPGQKVLIPRYSNGRY